MVISQSPDTGELLYPAFSQSLAAPADCTSSFHVTNGLLNKIVDRGQGLTISVDGVVQTPGYPAVGWEASEVVTGGQGETVSVEFILNGLGTNEVTIIEDWDKHCYAPSDH